MMYNEGCVLLRKEHSLHSVTREKQLNFRKSSFLLVYKSIMYPTVMSLDTVSTLLPGKLTFPGTVVLS